MTCSHTITVPPNTYIVYDFDVGRGWGFFNQEQKPTPCPYHPRRGLHVERGKPTCRLIVTIRVRSQTDPSPVYHLLRLGTRPPRRRSQCLLKQIIDLEIQYHHQPTKPPSHLGRAGG
jgi:hypothetical protein